LHFSVLASGDVVEEGEAKFGRIDKRKWGEDNFVVPSWTNGALESNVASIGRIEGEDLWHLI